MTTPNKPSYPFLGRPVTIADIDAYNERVVRDAKAAQDRLNAMPAAYRDHMAGGCAPVATPSPARDYCAETAERIAAIDAQRDAALLKVHLGDTDREALMDRVRHEVALALLGGKSVTLPREVESFRVSDGCNIKAGDLVAIDSRGIGIELPPVVTRWNWDADRAELNALIRENATGVPIVDIDAAMGPYNPVGYCTDPVQISPRKPSREDERRAIDTLLSRDAAATPAFATARRAAVLAFAEHDRHMALADAQDVLRHCRVYEAMRGGMARPSEAALEYTDDRLMPQSCAFVAYERARGMR